MRRRRGIVALPSYERIPPPSLGKRRRDGPPHLAESEADIADRLGNCGLMLLLFETPSGFAIFGFDGVLLYRPNAMENIWASFGWDYRAKKFAGILEQLDQLAVRIVVWLKEFQAFKDKSSAINSDTGVSDKLSRMILKWHRPEQILAVGNHEYKRIIEERMGIECVCHETVMEVMWGMNNVMPSFFGEEKTELTKDCPQMSRGLKMFLDRHGFDVKPEMVNKDIIENACVLYDFGDPKEMFSTYELSRLVDDAHKYDRRTLLFNCRQVYDNVVLAYEGKNLSKMLLEIDVNKAKEAYEVASLASTRLGSEAASTRSVEET
ncbi:hypothetical protein ACP70R_027148 [Stipagrostis hirtigluma subsp. patula]